MQPERSTFTSKYKHPSQSHTLIRIQTHWITHPPYESSSHPPLILDRAFREWYASLANLILKAQSSLQAYVHRETPLWQSCLLSLACASLTTCIQKPSPAITKTDPHLLENVCLCFLFQLSQNCHKSQISETFRVHLTQPTLLSKFPLQFLLRLGKFYFYYCNVKNPLFIINIIKRYII